MNDLLTTIEATLEVKSQRLLNIHMLYKDTIALLTHHETEASQYLNAEIDFLDDNKPKEAKAQRKLAEEHMEAAKKIRADYGGMIADFLELCDEVKALQVRRDALLGI